MKKSVFFRYAFIAALVFNLKLFQGDVWSRLTSINFFLLSVVMTGLFWGYAAWVSKQYCKLADEQYEVIGEQGVASLSRLGIFRYLGYAIVPVLLFHLGAIWCIVSIADDTIAIFRNYTFSYFPILVMLVTGYSLLLLFRPQYVLANNFIRSRTEGEPRSETPITSLDVPIHLYSVFYHLLKSGGMGPIMNGMATRFFDIVFIETYSKERWIILSNGERMLCDNILDELRKRGLDRWMIRISKNYYINMLHVFYPIELRSKKLKLQQEVYKNLLIKLAPEKIDEMRKIGPGMKNNPVKDFLVNTNSMDHKGWDDFIPVR